MILFETSTSVFELMWDISLTLFILRIAFIYFTLTYLSSLFLTFIRISRVVPYNHLKAPSAELVAFPMFLLCIVLWARTVIVYYQIPRVRPFRLAVGVSAGIFMVLAELIGGIIMWREGHKEWIWETSLLRAALGMLALVLFVVMPWLSMILEKIELQKAEPYHGHEKKSMTACIPTMCRTCKATQEDKKTI